MTILLSWPPQTKFALYVISISPQTECPSLIIPVYLSIHPPYLLLRSMFFPPCSLPVKGSFDVPLDLWLTLFNPVYNKQKALGLKVCARAESHHNQKQVLPVSHTILGFTVWPDICDTLMWGHLQRQALLICRLLLQAIKWTFESQVQGKSVRKGEAWLGKGMIDCFPVPVQFACMVTQSNLWVWLKSLCSLSPLLIRVCSFTLTPWLVPHYVAGQV